MITICHMVLLPPGVMPEREHLENGARLNPHGFGWAMVQENRLITSRSIDAADCINSFMSARFTWPLFHAVFHSRHAGSMPIGLEFNHPVLLDSRTVMLHNGYLFPVNDGRSDAVVFATEILPKWNLKDPAERAELEQRMGLNKAIVLSTDPAREPVTVLNEQLGITLDNGAWHSNADFLGTSHLQPGICGACGEPCEGMICPACEAAANAREELLRSRS